MDQIEAGGNNPDCKRRTPREKGNIEEYGELVLPCAAPDPFGASIL